MPHHPAAASMRQFVQTVQRSVEEGRTARYMRRVEAHIAGMSADDSLRFLRSELAKWEERYRRFSTDLFSGRPMTSDATAWDYAETIAALGAKIGRLERVPA